MLEAPVVTEIVPIHTDKHGVIRVSKTRVTLETIVETFKDGATPEEIAQRYPVVPLGDIYAVISYYLRRQDEVEIYLKKQQERSESVRKEYEARYNPVGIRERLLARMANKSS